MWQNKSSTFNRRIASWSDNTLSDFFPPLLAVLKLQHYSKVHFPPTLSFTFSFGRWQRRVSPLCSGSGIRSRRFLLCTALLLRAAPTNFSKTWHCITLESWTAQNIPIKKRAKKCRQGSPHFAKKNFFLLIWIPYNTSHAIWRSVTSICKTPF